MRSLVTRFKDFISDGDYSKSQELIRKADSETKKDSKTRWVVNTAWSGVEIVDVEPSDESTIIHCTQK